MQTKKYSRSKANKFCLMGQILIEGTVIWNIDRSGKSTFIVSFNRNFNPKECPENNKVHLIMQLFVK